MSHMYRLDHVGKTPSLRLSGRLAAWRVPPFSSKIMAWSDCRYFPSHNRRWMFSEHPGQCLPSPKSDTEYSLLVHPLIRIPDFAGDETFNLSNGRRLWRNSRRGFWQFWTMSADV